MDWETMEVRVEEMDWECDGYQESEPMNWEDIPEVRSPKRSKVSDLIAFKTNIPLQPSTSPQLKKQVSSPFNFNLNSSQVRTTPPALKKVNTSVDANCNLSFQKVETEPSPKIVSPLISPLIVRRKIRTRQKVSPQVSSSTSDRPILKARRPLSD
ncbi:hypothetical protein NPIL_359071 [Nephila pilipes]|uniref:Uncharacterized protein n=1 Tax=Nephila pilipes TaxID=299642 RepID=A0A8X6IR93_NEPPI|nr:hypothetical protein NPIL_359071 [Nephila pilipes]